MGFNISLPKAAKAEMQKATQVFQHDFQAVPSAVAMLKNLKMALRWNPVVRTLTLGRAGNGGRDEILLRMKALKQGDAQRAKHPSAEDKAEINMLAKRRTYESPLSLFRGRTFMQQARREYMAAQRDLNVIRESIREFGPLPVYEHPPAYTP